MRNPLLCQSLLLALTALILTGCSVTHVMRVQDREQISVQRMIAELDGAPLVFAGERHDAPAHHRLQLDILKGLAAQGKPLALAMEMFEEGSQKALDAWSAGKVPEYAIRKVFEGNWRNTPWGLYQDLMLFARDHRIPIVALNAPRDLVQAVAKDGFASLGGEQLARLPAGIDARVSSAFMQFMASAYSMHGRSGDSFRYMCEAQMLRNKVMARRLASYLERNPDRVLVVITGGAHARKLGGIPAELEQLRYKVLLPPVPGLDGDSITTGDADYLLEEPYFGLAELF